MWFTETPWPPFLICAVIAAGFFAQWYVQGNPRQLKISLAFLAIGGVIVLVEKLIVTESERVEANVYALAQAVEAGDATRSADFFSPSDAADRELVRGAVGRFQIDGRIRITDLSVEMSSAESRATSTFRASASVKFQGQEGHGATRWQLTWQREGKEWKIIRLRRLRFMGEGEQPPLSALE